MTASRIDKPLLGWREWVALPELGIEATKAKVDTGAKTCALHAHFVEHFQRDDTAWVRFGMHPLANDTDYSVTCEAPLADRRQVRDSGGHTELRSTIKTPVVIGGQSFEVEITLTDRDSMRFRMLLGRNLLNGRFLIDPQLSYLAGRIEALPESPIIKKNGLE